MVLQNYPLNGTVKAGALTASLPMSWFYERVHGQSNLLQDVSGEPAASAGGS